ALAGFLLEQGGEVWTGLTLVFFGFLGWSVTFLIEKVPPASEELEFDFNPFKRLAQNLSWIRHDSLMLLAVVGFVCSWLLGTVLTLNVNVFGLQTLEVGETLTSLLFVALALGLGTGNTLSGWLSGEKIEYGLIFPGLAGFSFCLLVIWFRLGGFYFSYLWMFLTGVFSGLFLIPLQSALQDRPPKKRKGEGLATANILTFAGVIAGTAVYVLLVQHLGVSALSLMLCLGGGGFVFAFFLLLIMPWLFRRFVIWILSLLFFKIEVSNKQFIPHRGPVLVPTGSLDLVRLLKLAYCIPLPLLVSGEIEGESFLSGVLFSRLRADDKTGEENVLTKKIDNNAEASSALCLPGKDFSDISSVRQENDIEIIKASVTDISPPETGCRSLLIRIFGNIARPVHIKFSSPPIA
ncbi:MAG: MFS transporter, partial [bacterium]